MTHRTAACAMSIIDQIWCNRTGIERVWGFYTEKEYQGFLYSALKLKNY
jgi:polyphosphate kinase 2 (PPK2 family)